MLNTLLNDYRAKLIGILRVVNILKEYEDILCDPSANSFESKGINDIEIVYFF